jgi:hypothetical protein
MLQEILINSRALGCGGLQEQIPYQGLDPQCTAFFSIRSCIVLTIFAAIIVKIKALSHATPSGPSA